MPREGTLLPETYKFPRGTTREQVIHRLQQSQKRVLAEIWERRNPDVLVKSPEQLITLASIIEKETGRADERSRVAAVFTNRLRQRIKLQSDPTIIYGLVGGKGTLGRPIKRSEITQPSPYNTYVIEGLPPGRSPIPAAPRSKQPPTRRARATCSSWPTGPAGTPLPRPTTSTRRTSPKLRALEKQIQNDTVEPTRMPVPTAAGAPADTNPTATTPRPAGPAKKPPARPAAPAAPARQGAAQSTTTPPVVQR